MSQLINALKKTGPCGSSKLTDFLVENYKLTRTTARQRISRRPKEVGCLRYIRLAKGQQFNYFKQDFGSREYCSSLISTLQENNSAYGFALAALKQRGGIMPVDHFKIACGSPIRQKKHLSATYILDVLQKEGVVELHNDKSLGNCVAIKWTALGFIDTSGLLFSLGGSPMSGQRYTPEFKDEAVKQVVDRGSRLTWMFKAPSK